MLPPVRREHFHHSHKFILSDSFSRIYSLRYILTDTFSQTLSLRYILSDTFSGTGPASGRARSGELIEVGLEHAVVDLPVADGFFADCFFAAFVGSDQVEGPGVHGAEAFSQGLIQLSECICIDT